MSFIDDTDVEFIVNKPPVLPLGLFMPIECRVQMHAWLMLPVITSCLWQRYTVDVERRICIYSWAWMDFKTFRKTSCGAA